MDLVNIFKDLFWETATQGVVLIVPIISIILIMKLIHSVIIRGSD